MTLLGTGSLEMQAQIRVIAGCEIKQNILSLNFAKKKQKTNKLKNINNCCQIIYSIRYHTTPITKKLEHCVKCK